MGKDSGESEPSSPRGKRISEWWIRGKNGAVGEFPSVGHLALFVNNLNQHEHPDRKQEYFVKLTT